MKHLFIILFLFIAINEVHSKTKIPQWVTDRTSNPEYYIGVGYAQKEKKTTKHYDIAAQAALRALTEDISVSVKSSTILIDLALDEKTLSDLSSIVQIRAKNDIEGYEVADSYETKKEYWVYYRLSKQKYAQQQAIKRQKAIELAQEAFNQAVEYENEKNLKNAIIHYAKAMDAIKGYLNEKITLPGQDISLITLAYNAISHITADMNIIVSGSTNATLGKTSTLLFTVNNNNSLIANIPLAIKYTERALYGIEKITNTSGVLTCKIDPVQSKKGEETLSASIDLNSMLVESNVDYILRQWLLQIPTPNVSTNITIKKPSIYIKTSESNMGKEIKDKDKILINCITELLKQKNYTITTSEKTADCTLEIVTNTSRKSVINGVHSVALSGKIQLLNNEGKSIYNKQLMNILGNQLSDEKAGMNAYREATKQLETRFVQDIENAISKGF